MTQTQGQLAGRFVLIVDDESDIRETVETVFKSEGARTLTCSDGNRAVQICLNDKPDLVILDMMLPGRSGFLVLEKIKGYEDSPVVIMITANEGKRHEAYARALGVDDYLNKPFRMDRLMTSIQTLLGVAESN